MAKRFLGFVFFATLSSALVVPLCALEKQKLGSTIKMTAVYYLPVFAAEEKGFWKANGLEVEWVPFSNPPAFFRAAAGGHIQVGFAMTDSVLTAVDRGLPGTMVAELVPLFPVLIWVRTDSPYRKIQDLRGARIGISSLGGVSHVYSRIIAKANGIENDIRFVAVGGPPQALAGLRAGAYEATVNSLAVSVHLKVQGVIREIGSNADYLPMPWVDVIFFARKDFAKSKADVLRNMVKATLQSMDFATKNLRWSVDKIKSFQGLSEEPARLVFETYPFSTTGRLDREAVENVRSVLMQYRILTDKAPPVDDLFTNDYLPQ